MLQSARPEEDIPADALGIVRLARVLSVDRASATCTVALGDPEDPDDGEVQSQPLPWLAPRAGSLRIWAPPAVGEQVLLICPEGDLGQAMVGPALWCNAFPPPGDLDGMLARFADTGRFSYDAAAHHCELILPAGATLAVHADGGITLTGDVAITGDVTVSGTLTAQTDVIGGGKSLKNHRHTEVRVGTAISGPPQ